jgi:hypothetical protein
VVVFRFVGRVGGVVSAMTGSISIAAKSQRSPVGAVSFGVTELPVAIPAAAWLWTQQVSHAGARYWSERVWPLPTVRARARSQSLPTPQTHELVRVAVSETDGAPLMRWRRRPHHPDLYRRR